MAFHLVPLQSNTLDHAKGLFTSASSQEEVSRVLRVRLVNSNDRDSSDDDDQVDSDEGYESALPADPSAKVPAAAPTAVAPAESIGPAAVGAEPAMPEMLRLLVSRGFVRIQEYQLVRCTFLKTKQQKSVDAMDALCVSHPQYVARSDKTFTIKVPGIAMGPEPTPRRDTHLTEAIPLERVHAAIEQLSDLADHCDSEKKKEASGGDAGVPRVDGEGQSRCQSQLC